MVGVGAVFCSAGEGVVSTASGSVCVGAIVCVVGKSVSISKDDVCVTYVGIDTEGKSVGTDSVDELVNVAVSDVEFPGNMSEGTVRVAVVVVAPLSVVMSEVEVEVVVAVSLEPSGADVVGLSVVVVVVGPSDPVSGGLVEVELADVLVVVQKSGKLKRPPTMSRRLGSHGSLVGVEVEDEDVEVPEVDSGGGVVGSSFVLVGDEVDDEHDERVIPRTTTGAHESVVDDEADEVVVPVGGAVVVAASVPEVASVPLGNADPVPVPVGAEELDPDEVAVLVAGSVEVAVEDGHALTVMPRTAKGVHSVVVVELVDDNVVLGSGVGVTVGAPVVGDAAGVEEAGSDTVADADSDVELVDVEVDVADGVGWQPSVIPRITKGVHSSVELDEVDETEVGAAVVEEVVVADTVVSIEDDEDTVALEVGSVIAVADEEEATAELEVEVEAELDRVDDVVEELELSSSLSGPRPVRSNRASSTPRASRSCEAGLSAWRPRLSMRRSWLACPATSWATRTKPATAMNFMFSFCNEGAGKRVWGGLAAALSLMLSAGAHDAQNTEGDDGNDGDDGTTELDEIGRAHV